MRSAVFFAAAALVSCRGDDPRPPAAAGCVSGAVCAPPQTGSGGPPIVGADAGSLDGGDAEPTSVDVTGTVHPLRTFTGEVDPSAERVRAVTVRALRRGGGVAESTSPDGTFALTEVAASVGAPTWLTLIESGQIRGFAGIGLPNEGAFALPLFDELLPLTTAQGLGLVVAGDAFAVVVHVVDDAGRRRAGIRAEAAGDLRPFYDDGRDAIGDGGTATGDRGTIVFIGSGTPPNPFPVTLATAARTYGTISAPAATSAVTWLRVALP
jgi:hypothetical protein